VSTQQPKLVPSNVLQDVFNTQNRDEEAINAGSFGQADPKVMSQNQEERSLLLEGTAISMKLPSNIRIQTKKYQEDLYQIEPEIKIHKESGRD